jgi:hypothetical protein
VAIAVTEATDPVGIVPIARGATTTAEGHAPTATAGVLAPMERRPVSEANGLAATGPTDRRVPGSRPRPNCRSARGRSA